MRRSAALHNTASVHPALTCDLRRQCYDKRCEDILGRVRRASGQCVPGASLAPLLSEHFGGGEPAVIEGCGTVQPLTGREREPDQQANAPARATAGREPRVFARLIAGCREKRH